jgi:hypothetical protein
VENDTAQMLRSRCFQIRPLNGKNQIKHVLQKMSPGLGQMKRNETRSVRKWKGIKEIFFQNVLP